MIENRHPVDYRPIVLIALLVALTVNGALVGWLYLYSIQLPHAALSKPIVDGNTDLCPGETLNYRFALSVTKKADVDLYTTVDREQSSDRVSYSRLQQFHFDKQSDLEISRHWTLPPTYLDPISGLQVTWEPGPYIQGTKASIPTSRDESSRIAVPFSVRANCP